MSHIIETLATDQLNIQVISSPLGFTMTWRGVSDTREPNLVLVPFMQQVARKLRGKRVLIDFTAFEYMNSATVAPIVQFIKLLDAGETSTVLVYNTNVSWQRVSCVCMTVVARTLTHVEVRETTRPVESPDPEVGSGGV
jgi:hypothetical protein